MPAIERAKCGRWMPRKGTYCARTPGHGGDCMTPEEMERRRAYKRVHPHIETPEVRKKHNRKSRITAYGITVERFTQILASQGNACGMCHEPFEDGQLIHIDHDHGCCDTDCRACGDCVRGLLCHRCPVALGYVETYREMADAYLATLPAKVGGRGVEPLTSAL